MTGTAWRPRRRAFSRRFDLAAGPSAKRPDVPSGDDGKPRHLGPGRRHREDRPCGEIGRLSAQLPSPPDFYGAPIAERCAVST